MNDLPSCQPTALMDAPFVAIDFETDLRVRERPDLRADQGQAVADAFAIEGHARAGAKGLDARGHQHDGRKDFGRFEHGRPFDASTRGCDGILRRSWGGARRRDEQGEASDLTDRQSMHSDLRDSAGLADVTGAVLFPAANPECRRVSRRVE